MASRINVIRPIPGRTMFLVCDIQTRFTNVIHEFKHIVSTTNKMMKVAKVLNIPVIVSEQNPAKLGKTVSDINLDVLGPLLAHRFEKSSFSLVSPELEELMHSEPYNNIKSVVLMGIESHICVLQTTFDLIERGYDVHVLADGVSSCNKEEITFALARMRQAGAEITTSESVAFQLMVDSANPSFKEFQHVIKEEIAPTRAALYALFGPDSRS